MEQTVYVDLLFMINFSMDFLCLFLVAKLLARHFSLLRTTFAAILGGLYSVASLFVPHDGLGGTALDLLFCLFLCLVAFASRRERPGAMLVLSASFFLASMLLGGIMTAIFNLLNRMDPPWDSFSEQGDMPVWLFAAVAAISSAITWLGGRFLRTRAQASGATVEVQLLGRSACLHALCDSGNLVRDTVSGRPVIVASLRRAKEILPPETPDITEWNSLGDRLPPSLASRICVVPIQTAAGSRILYALRPDQTRIRAGTHTRSADVLIGFAELHGIPADCDALLPPELII